MPYLSTDDTAALVATALTDAAVGGLTFTRSRFPKYALRDLAAAKAHVVPVWPTRVDPHDDEGVAIETPLAITLDAKCEKNDDATLAKLIDILEAVANVLSATNISQLGYPVEQLTIDVNPEMLDGGHFCGGVGVVYRRYRDSGGDL